MSNNAASASVIQMRDFDRPAPSQQANQFERLLEECQELALGSAEKSVSAMFDKVEDPLWAAAHNAADHETRELYRKAKDVVLAQRKVIEEQFRTRFLAEFESRSARNRKAGGEFSKYDLSSLELGLVEEEDLDETLKINEMAAKLRRYCDEELAALDQRIGVLLGDATLQGDANPFSPQAICNAYKLACQQVEPDPKVRAVFRRLFDDHVLDDIRSIYKDLNALLVQRSILPKIRYGSQRQGAGSPNARGLPPVAGIGEGAGGATTEQDFFAVLQNLMGLGAGLQRGAVPAGAPLVQVAGFPPIVAGTPAAGAGGQALLQGPELLGSLTRIQQGDLSSLAGINLPPADALVHPGMTNVLRELKGTTFGTGLGQVDSMTLDIVILLFDQIFDDSKLPSAMKGLIGRLQIPMLKVAILDKEFFSKKTHPARRLLDTLGEVALGLPADFGTSTPLYTRLDSVIQRLIDGFEDSVDIFDTLRGELEQVLAEENQGAEEEVRATAQRIEQKEKLEVAKALVQQEIKTRAESRRIPSIVLKFLAGQWVKLLLITHAKHGADSVAYKSAIGTMDLLIWSVTPMESAEERRLLATRLPGLLKRIQYGMQIVGTDEATRRTFFAKLMRCHTNIINGTVPGRAPVAKKPPTRSAIPMPAPESSTQSSPQPASSTPLPAAPAVASAPPAPPPSTGAEPSLDFTGEIDADTAPAEAPPEFSAVTIRNPFGEGEIQVEEIRLSDIPGPFSTAQTKADVRGSDEYTRMAGSLKAGAWIEFREEGDTWRPARLSYISPLKGTYLFVNRQGKKIGEHSLVQLAREFRSGRAVLLEEVPLFDRAMTSLVGVLKGPDKPH